MLLRRALGNWLRLILPSICLSSMYALVSYLTTGVYLTDEINLQARIHDKDPSARATVVSAIRYTFADTTQSYDELLAPLLVDFLSLMLDEDLVSYISYSFFYNVTHASTLSLDCPPPRTLVIELGCTYQTPSHSGASVDTPA
jgi:hypothetical protein